jgi:hypothetical protein
MNSMYEWTVFRETMSFYGAARNRLIPVEDHGESSVRVAVSASFVPVGADRQIGVWCIRL